MMGSGVFSRKATVMLQNSTNDSFFHGFAYANWQTSEKVNFSCQILLTGCCILDTIAQKVNKGLIKSG